MLMGPDSRNFLQGLLPEGADKAILSNEEFPFGTCAELEIGYAITRAHRVSYVGELGWELYTSAEMSGHVYETIMDHAATVTTATGATAPAPGAGGSSSGVPLLRHVGLHAMDSLRIEKGYRHYGHDIGPKDHVLEAGLGFAVKTSKPKGKYGDFIGKESVLARAGAGVGSRLLQFQVQDPAALVFHNEPVLRDGAVVGYLSSGNYGHALGGAIGLGYVPCRAPGESVPTMLSSEYSIDIAGKEYPAIVSHKPLYDPTGAKTKA